MNKVVSNADEAVKDIMVGAVLMLGGFGFFLSAEVSRQAGVAGIVPPFLAVWVPVIAACCAALAVLLHQEDG